MVSNKYEALALCKKFEINLKDHDTVIVTSNGNIYLSDNIDPKDPGQKFYLKGNTVSIEEVPKTPEKTADELALEKEIADEEAAKLAATTTADDSKKSK